MRRFVPNLLTLLNLMSGVVAVVLIVYSIVIHEPQIIQIAVALILIGAIFDVFDGFVARKLGVASPLGLQLDSLADLITFSFAPAALYVHIQVAHVHPGTDLLAGILSLFPLILIAFSAYRLAKFNIDTEQRYYFKGLATPASALFTIGFALAIENNTTTPLLELFLRCPYFIPTVALLQGILLVSNIPMFSLKFKKINLHTLLPHILFAGFMLLCIVLLQWEGIAIGMLFYILLSILFRKRIKIL